jgi:hypothetical protein
MFWFRRKVSDEELQRTITTIVAQAQAAELLAGAVLRALPTTERERTLAIMRQTLLRLDAIRPALIRPEQYELYRNEFS